MSTEYLHMRSTELYGYPNRKYQFLLIGHKDHSFAKATETDDKEADPKEEIEKLGEEDERRVKHLEGEYSTTKLTS